MDNVEKINAKTFDIVSDNIEKLKEIFPELVTEGKVDIDNLHYYLINPRITMKLLIVVQRKDMNLLGRGKKKQ